MFETSFYTLAAVILVGVPLYAWRVRGRTYAIFGGVVLGLSMPGLFFTLPNFAVWFPEPSLPYVRFLALYCLGTAGIHMAHLVRARMRSRTFRLLVSVPGQATIAGGFLTVGWLLLTLPVRALFAVLEFDVGSTALVWLGLLPPVVALISIFTSARPVVEVVRVTLGTDGPADVTRMPVERHRKRMPPALDTRPLRIVQITDPHLGPWQSVRALREIVSNLAEHEPDLFLLTGDFLTMESMGTPGSLHEALAPLKAHPGRCFAIFGNHDHEAPEEVRAALAHNGIELLVDQETIVETPVGPVQLIGADYVGRGRGEHLKALLGRFARREDHVRLLMLHDPLGFRDIESGAVDLVLSGHTHGGQVGLVSLGFDWTVLTRSPWPDHGLFALGSNRLYVHRGTGFYGFPLRVGVPGEASLMELIVNEQD